MQTGASTHQTHYITTPASASSSLMADTAGALGEHWLSEQENKLR